MVVVAVGVAFGVMVADLDLAWVTVWVEIEVAVTVTFVLITIEGNDMKSNEMRKIVEQVSGEGLEKLLGKRITLFCMNYIYTGTLIGVNEQCVLLSDPAIVYETGELTSSVWKDAQKLPNEWYVFITSIESCGILK